jgi:prepilin-type N-terminal cleavage/methylation domain-containing protein
MFDINFHIVVLIYLERFRLFPKHTPLIITLKPQYILLIRHYKDMPLNMNSVKTKDQSGFSLAEVLVVIVIISIIVVFAVAQFGNSADSFETENIARELKVRFERARFDSVKRRPANVVDMSRVVINNETSFSYSMDSNQNNQLETSETQTVDFSGRTNIKILQNGMNFPVTVIFDRRGHITATDGLGAEINPAFTVCNNCTSETANNSNALIVALSATGTVSMYHWDESPPDLHDPTVTTIGSNTDIDPMIAIQENVPAPAGTPAPTPTITPTPTPEGSPTASATPTPTPTPPPDICERSERPAQTGCICMSPMRILGNGQCK